MLQTLRVHDGIRMSMYFMTKLPVLSPSCACGFAVQCCGVVGCHRQHRDALWTAAVGGASLPICVRPQVLLAAVGCAHDAILYLSCGRQPDCILWVSNAMHSCCVLTHVAKQGSGIGLWRSGLFFRLTLSSRLHCSATASASRTRHARRQCSRHDRRCRRTSWRCRLPRLAEIAAEAAPSSAAATAVEALATVLFAAATAFAIGMLQN